MRLLQNIKASQTETSLAFFKACRCLFRCADAQAASALARVPNAAQSAERFSDTIASISSNEGMWGAVSRPTRQFLLGCPLLRWRNSTSVDAFIAVPVMENATIGWTVAPSINRGALCTNGEAVAGRQAIVAMAIDFGWGIGAVIVHDHFRRLNGCCPAA
jgi:hypothetical protein